MRQISTTYLSMRGVVICLLLFYHYLPTRAQAPSIMWNKTVGTPTYELGQLVFKTPDGGSLLCMSTTSDSTSGKTSRGKGAYDIWVVKLDSSGQQLWDRSFGGAGNEQLEGGILTQDGGLVLVGLTASPASGDVEEPNRGLDGWADYWVLKIDLNGNKLWARRFGGIYGDRATSVAETSDGKLIVAGTSNSLSGADKSENPRQVGYSDFWVLKLDANGNKLWDKVLGGVEAEDQPVVVAAANGGCYVVGFTYLYETSSHYVTPPSGDRSQSGKGGCDLWLLLLAADGTKVWDKVLGGNDDDKYPQLTKLANGELLISCYSISNRSGDKSENIRGGFDVWVLRLNPQGAIIWEKTLGGDGFDGFTDQLEFPNGNLLLAGMTFSNQTGEKSEPKRANSYDIWLLYLSSNGTLLWEKTLGGIDDESETTLIRIDAEQFYLGCRSFSGQSYEKTESARGLGDSWLLKMNVNCISMHTVATGLWNSPGTWSCRRQPSLLDRVKLRQGHTVTIPNSINATAGSIRYEGGTLRVDPRGRLFLRTPQ
ncbi:hypothetical protein [Fibrella aquatilis]|uniref:Bulb-type lectin domain-containing protein n=1 Tax=Fibrella aquatilis TaxID=2817059 RepID=A0A939K2X1_9BACT|nr:hypothetical protein [Fibrella aquatilis]MBO0934526.1 hypothetical protein [Fibrella aquatilis]